MKGKNWQSNPNQITHSHLIRTNYLNLCTHTHTHTLPFLGSVFLAPSAESPTACLSLRLCKVLMVSMCQAMLSEHHHIHTSTIASWELLSFVLFTPGITLRGQGCCTVGHKVTPPTVEDVVRVCRKERKVTTYM